MQEFTVDGATITTNGGVWTVRCADGTIIGVNVTGPDGRIDVEIVRDLLDTIDAHAA